MNNRLMFIILALCCFLQACGGLKLTDIPKSTAALQLSESQKQAIQPKLQLISDIVEDYNFEKKQLETDYQLLRSGIRQRQFDRYSEGYFDPGRRRELTAFREEARKFMRQRELFLKEIEKLLKEIAAELTATQQDKLAELKMPELIVPMMLRPDDYNALRYIPNHPLGGTNLF